MSDAVLIALISMMGSLLTVAFTLWTQILVKRQEAKLTQTQSAIVTLEQNTNSIKDALVEVTRKAAFARGMKAGAANGASIADSRAEAASAAAAVASAAAIAASQVATAAAAAAAALQSSITPVIHAATLEAIAESNTEDAPLNVKIVE